MAEMSSGDLGSPGPCLTDLEAQVRACLRGLAPARQVAGCDLTLVLHERGLILRGRAATYHVKQLAQHAVMERARVPILANEIEVV